VPPPRATETDLLAEGEELVAGRRPVEEAFAAARPALRLLVVPERRQALEALVLHATTLRIPVVEVEGGTLTSLAGFDGHQGVALAVEARPPATLDDVLARARQRGQPPFLLVLDSLEDPQNLGTLLRSAEACAVDGVVFPTRRSAPLSPAAIKASAGATEHLLLMPVDDLAAALVDLRARGLRLIGADEGASLRYGDADLRGPLALVVGSEGRGISGALRRRLDMVVRIPMRGRVASLNAAVAGSVLLFAAADQRGVAEAGEGNGSPAPDAAPDASPDAEVDAQPPAAAGTPTRTRRKAAGSRSKVAPEPPSAPAADDAAQEAAAEAADEQPADGTQAAPDPVASTEDELLPGAPAPPAEDEASP
jgi:23S rRNA (guanosine2251-2'-O)-methyltransferase